MEIVLIFIIVAITIMYVVDEIADIFKAKYKNKDKESKWYYDKPSKTIRVFRRYICRSNRFIHEVQR